MPKKNGIIKTYSFSNDIIEKMDILCKEERRTQTSLLEYLIAEYYRQTMHLDRIEELQKMQLETKQKKDKGDS